MAINGTSGRDILRGDLFFGIPTADEINGFGGDDDLFGLGGNDTLRGGDGNDFLKGGEGNDVLFGGANNDVLISGERDPLPASAEISGPPLTNGGFDFLGGGAGDDRLIVTLDTASAEIDGGDGTDTLQIGFNDSDVQGFLNAFPSQFQTDPSLFEASINLATGIGRYRFNGSLIDLTLAISEIENVDGSAFSETITGDSGANVIRAKGGNDVLFGGVGADTLDGGPGRDRANYSGFLSSGVTIDLTLAVQSGSADERGDRLISIEDIGGTRNADVIRGDANANGLFGNDGDDILEGRGGADTLNGGSGIDTASYASSKGRVIVKLADAASKLDSFAAEADATGDKLISIENLVGSEFGDNLTGNSGANVISGGNGNDALFGMGGNDTIDGGNGNDLIDGGEGTDTATFASATQGLQITLRDGVDGTARQSFLFSDALRSIENIIGSEFDDAIFGNSADNVLLGRGGDDYFTGSRGRDRLDGGEGTDTLDLSGETGAIHLDLSVGTGLTTFSDGGFLTYFGRPDDFDEVSNIERYVGTPFADIMIGSFSALGSGANVRFLGNGGDDTYIINNASLVVQEFVGGGFDRVLVNGELSGAGFPSDNVLSYTLLAGQSIERLETTNAQGTAPINLTGNDLSQTIVGNAGANVLSGGGGPDVLEGGGGDDTLAGGEGDDFLNGGLPVFGAAPEFDFADYSSATRGVTVNLALSGQDTGQGFDRLFSIEGVIGSAFNDTFFGNGFGNAFRGGTGSDTISYAAVNPSTVAGGVRVDLALTGFQDVTSLGGLDKFDSIENATGSNSGADNLLGDAGDNRLEGLGGNDRLAGRGGNDTLLGGPDNDVYEFLGSSLGQDLISDISGSDKVLLDFRDLRSVVRDGDDLVATLVQGTFRVAGHFTGTAVEEAQDAITGRIVTLAVGLTGGDGNGIIAGTDKGETLDGRGGDDLLFGAGGKDLLLGGLGNDFLDGGAGKDTLIGGLGNDTLVGGDDADTFVINPGSGHDVILDFGIGKDRVDLTAFRTSFRSLDTNHNHLLEDGEGSAALKVSVHGGDTTLVFAGGSLAITSVNHLTIQELDF